MVRGRVGFGDGFRGRREGVGWPSRGCRIGCRGGVEEGNFVVAAAPSRRPSAEWKGFVGRVGGRVGTVPFRVLWWALEMGGSGRALRNYISEIAFLTKSEE